MKLIQKLTFILIFASFWNNTNAQFLKKLESSDELYKMAKRDIELKKYQKAINECRQGVSVSPRNLDIHLLLGRAYSLAGKIDSARIEMNLVIEKNPRYRDAYIYLVSMEATACNYLQALEYADMGLKYFPNDKDLLLRKLDIYNKEGDWLESDRLAAYLFERYSNDPYIRSIYLEYKLSLARHYYSHGYIDIALRSYESVLEQDPLNKEALESIYNLDVKSGNYAKSLASVNRALLSNPNSFELLLKKINILEAMSLYVDALSVINKLLRLYPNNAQIIKMNTYLRMDAGVYYMNADPYMLFAGVLEKDPGNREALNYVINIAFMRGQYTEALTWINVGLKRSPNDRDLLQKKLGILEAQKAYGGASVIAETLYKQNPSQDSREHMLELKNLAARQYLAEQENDSAIVIIKTVLTYDPANLQATNYLISIYVQQKKYDEALHTIDESLKQHPNNEQLLFRKAGVLADYQKHTESAQISRQLLEKNPSNKNYLISFVEEYLAAGRQYMQYDDYYSTIKILKEVLDKQPNNLDALNYMINVETAVKNYDSAIFYVNQGIGYYPDSKELLFRKSLVYADAKEYRKAYEISGGLYNDYPYNTRFKNTYIEQILSSGKQYLGQAEQDSALTEFNKALAIAPNDTTTMYYTINLLNDKQMHDSALVLIERGRRIYPINPYFLIKRAVVLEKKTKFEEAWKAMDTVSRMIILDQRYIDYKDLLYSMQLKNEFGIFYLHSTYDSGKVQSNIASFQYTRKFEKASLIFRLDYAGRDSGAGFQFNAEAYLNHTIKWYSYLMASYSPSAFVFPTYRLGYSLFHSFPKAWDGELGVRMLRSDSLKIYSGLSSVSRQYKDFYFNLRVFGSYMLLNNGYVEGPYYSGVFSTRYYIKDSKADFFSVLMGYGRAPDDFSSLYRIGQVISLTTVSLGAGYQRQLHFRTTLATSFTWSNMEWRSNNYKNQYDLNLSLLHKF